jgi:hypothetical protein
MGDKLFGIKEKTENYKEHVCSDGKNPKLQCWTDKIPETVVLDNGMKVTFDFTVLYAYDGSFTYTRVLNTKIILNDEEIQDYNVIRVITNFLQDTYFDYSVYDKPEFIFDTDQEY